MRLPTKWSEVRLKQYIEICDISAIDMDELDKQVKIVAVLSGEPESKVLDMNLSDLKACIRKVQFIYTPPAAGHIYQYIRIGRHKFSVNTNLKKIAAGEYIDLTGYIKEQDKVTANLPQIISIFLHPVNWFGFKKSKYYKDGTQTLESRNRTAKIIEDMPMDKVMTLSAFFLNSSKALTEATLDFSILKMKIAERKLNKMIKKDLRSTGDGS